MTPQASRSVVRVAINGRFLNQAVTGVQRYARAVLEELDQAAELWGDVRFVLLTPKLNDLPPPLKNIEISERGQLSGQLWEQLELPMQRDFDLLLCLGNSAPAAVLLTGRKVVTVVHDLSHQLYPQGYTTKFRAIYAALFPLIMRMSKAVVTVSESARTTILDRYPQVSGRLHVVLNGGAPKVIADDRGPPVEGPYVLYVGSLSRLKNVDSIYEVAKRVLMDYPDYRFVMVGKRSTIFQGPGEKDRSLSDRLIFAGQLDDFTDLARYYRHATAFVFPSRSESSGLPPIEAMAFGCPVVASGIPGLIERCGEAAVYCDPNRPEDIYAKLKMVLDNQELRRSLAAKGRLQAARYTWRGCALSLLQIVKSVAPGTSTPRVLVDH